MYLLTVRHLFRLFFLFFWLTCFFLPLFNILLLILLLLILLWFGLYLLPFNLLLRNILTIDANPNFLKALNGFLNNLPIVDNL